MCSAAAKSTRPKVGKRRNAPTIERVRPLRRVDAFEGVERLEPWRPGKWQPWTPIKEAIAAAVGCLFPAELGKLLEELEGLEGLRLRKRQPIKESIAAAVGCSWAIAVALWWRLPAVWAWQGNRRYVQADSRLQRWNRNGWPARADGHKAWWKLPRGSCREAP